MQNLSSVKKGESIHHFNIVEGATEKDAVDFCRKILNFNSKSNPNYFYQKYDNFLVDDARELIKKQNRKNKKGELSVFVIETGSINHQAQNALLKIFEESNSHTYYFLLVPQSNILLQTLISRAEIYKNDNENPESDEDKIFPDLNEIEKMPIKERMKLVTKMLDDYKKEKIQKSDLKNFINKILKQQNQKILEGNKSDISKLEKFHDLSKYFDQNGAHLKSLLEFIVINI